MKRKILICLAFAVILSTTVVGFTGCSSNPDYINSKYSVSFTSDDSVSTEEEGEQTYFQYSDPDGNVVEVIKEDGMWKDNYYSVLYDAEIESRLCGLFDFDYRIDVSSAYTYTEQNEKYDSVDAYLESAPNISIVFYSVGTPDQAETVQTLNDALGGNCSLSVQFRSVTADDLATMEE